MFKKLIAASPPVTPGRHEANHTSANNNYTHTSTHFHPPPLLHTSLPSPQSACIVLHNVSSCCWLWSLLSVWCCVHWRSSAAGSRSLCPPPSVGSRPRWHTSHSSGSSKYLNVLTSHAHTHAHISITNEQGCTQMWLSDEKLPLLCIWAQIFFCSISCSYLHERVKPRWKGRGEGSHGRNYCKRERRRRGGGRNKV